MKKVQVLKCSQRWELLKIGPAYKVQSLMIEKSFETASISLALNIYELLNQGASLSSVERIAA